jgi:hypothetical protein
VLATPAWRGQDQLPELLAAWAESTDGSTPACLYLLADPSVDGDPAALEARVLAAAAATGADIAGAADINVLMEPSQPERDHRLHAAVDIYVPLHPACSGHRGMAAAAGKAVVAIGSLGDVVRSMCASRVAA